MHKKPSFAYAVARVSKTCPWHTTPYVLQAFGAKAHGASSRPHAACVQGALRADKSRLAPGTHACRNPACVLAPSYHTA
eukprot:5128116-Amphidinium_carterae.1